VVFILLGLLSRRLGRVTRSQPYYIGFFVAALLYGISVFVQLALNLEPGVDSALKLSHRPDVLIFLVLLPALAVSIAAYVSWHYWSWLLAERA
jgi:hypothetical protein